MKRKPSKRLGDIADIIRLGKIAKTLPAGAAVSETRTGGTIVLADGRTAMWHCGDAVAFATTGGKRARRWVLPTKTKAAIQALCARR